MSDNGKKDMVYSCPKCKGKCRNISAIALNDAFVTKENHTTHGFWTKSGYSCSVDFPRVIELFKKPKMPAYPPAVYRGLSDSHQLAVKYAVLIVMLGGLVLLYNAMLFGEVIPRGAGISNYSDTTGALLTSNVSIGISIVAVILSILVFYKAEFDWNPIDETAESQREIIYKQKMVKYKLACKRFYEARYCSECHIIFDEQGNNEPMTEEGMEKLLYAPEE